ncbi:glycosyl hydrolase family 28-related protein [Paenibacillus ginsengarvi]|uniref:Rhamnogalacturonase A/B/Epimerase-like pectate lyase domain-containing protein n=1 Tax=Paenibacillus ginsengarvi TaxID=400777 RepID=A0A3B0CN10_9BACL|nr:glycosyl hydrolase family 28-related protein [Paenibacillus ginsengarvi]RKN86261.1 hypothetical protein D7M11_04420 [Paenibacillus ginsengarvi]
MTETRIDGHNGQNGSEHEGEAGHRTGGSLEKQMSRRRLLTSIGLAGTAVVTAGVFHGAEALTGKGVSDSVYGKRGHGDPRLMAALAVTDAKDYGATGDGITDDSSSLTDAIADLSDGGDLLFPPGHYRIGSNLTFPAKITLVFANGARLAPDAGIVVTIEGCVDASLTHIFEGAGTVQGLLREEAVYP